MPVLDVRTIERLAELICDLGGLHERSVRRLRRFLEGAGWDAPYDAGPQGRVPWLSDTIKAHNDDEEAIAALLRRVVDPREYDGGPAEAETFVEPMNALLAADGFEVGLDRGRPFVRRDDAGETASLKRVAAALASPELRTTVRSLVSDQALADILISRLDEVEAARNAGAFVLAVVGTGSFIEGLLHDVMRLRDPEIRKAESAIRCHAHGGTAHQARAKPQHTAVRRGADRGAKCTSATVQFHRVPLPVGCDHHCGSLVPALRAVLP